MYEIEVSFEELGKYRVIRGSDPYIVQQKANAQLETWEAMWERKQAADEKRADRELRAENKLQAQIDTEEAEKVLQELEQLLSHTLSVNDVVDFKRLEDHSTFSEKKPQPYTPQPLPKEPLKSDVKYQPKLDFFDKIFTKRKLDKIAKAELRFESDVKTWTAEKKRIEELNLNRENTYQSELKKWTNKKPKTR